MKIDIDTLKKTKGIGSKTLERIIEQHNLDKGIRSFKSGYVPSDKYTLDEDINLWQGDCLELMHHIPDKSVDMVLCDLPYGTTACSWDEVIPFEPLWSHYRRIIKDNGAVVLFGSEPFSSKLRMSNLDWYKYDWKWKKNKSSNHINAPFQPLKKYEDVMIFSPAASTYSNQRLMLYNPQGLYKLDEPKVQRKGIYKVSETFNSCPNRKSTIQVWGGYPESIVNFNVVMRPVHPTQKPVSLLEYLIKTYTNEGMTVLDNTMGSGSTGVAAKNTNRRFIGIELDKKYYDIAVSKIHSIE